jgi:hypothetical protein
MGEAPKLDHDEPIAFVSRCVALDGDERDRRSTEILHDVESGAAPVGAVAETILVHEDIGRVKHDWPVGAGIDKFLRGGRHAGADFDRPEGIGDVIDPDAGVLIGGEDQPRALE